MYRCSKLSDTVDGGDHDGDYRDEDSTLSWLKEMGVQDKIKKPDLHTLQLYPHWHCHVRLLYVYSVCFSVTTP